MTDNHQRADAFLQLIRQQQKGRLKLYVGMSAGVGKTYRMLQEAHALLAKGVDVKIGFVETHQRPETEALVNGLPVIERRRLFYKGKALEEMDVDTILHQRPEVVVVDELAHTNVEGSKNQKRWQDVVELLEAGLHVISAVNIQHLESLNDEVKEITGVEVKERVPDSLLQMADEVVNIDLTAGELIDRLKAGKIYTPDKVDIALKNFFQPQHILQLRELALKAVAAQVERKVDAELPAQQPGRAERFLACISGKEKTSVTVIRKTARLASYYNSRWFVLHVQLPGDGDDQVSLQKQRKLIHQFQLAVDLGAEIIKLPSADLVSTIVQQVRERRITTLCISSPPLQQWRLLTGTNWFAKLMKEMEALQIDLVILS